MDNQIRELFPAAILHTYLNSAAVSPMPKIAVEAVLSQLRDVSEYGTMNYRHWLATKERARELLAKMMNVRGDQIAFMRNTSDGFSSIANGMNWSEGENVVSFAREFPANFYPWRRLRDKFGIELRLVRERNGRIDLDELISLIDANTRIVSISAVQFSTGFRADLERIGRAARAQDALFVVDIIQALGAMPLDLPAQFVDAACGASHKWLCSPEGCGILYLSDRALARIEPTLVGWISVKDTFNFDDVEQPFRANALAWESGTDNSSLFYGLEQSLKLLYETGAEKIASYLEGLTDELCEHLAAKNYEIVSSRARGEKSQIVSIRPKQGFTSHALFELLERENVIVSPRGDLLRIAPHFFNNRADIERICEVLP
jgi:selenocysteine lyase/cysteine desulfurase